MKRTAATFATAVLLMIVPGVAPTSGPAAGAGCKKGRYDQRLPPMPFAFGASYEIS